MNKKIPTVAEQVAAYQFLSRDNKAQLQGSRQRRRDKKAKKERRHKEWK